MNRTNFECALPLKAAEDPHLSLKKALLNIYQRSVYG